MAALGNQIDPAGGRALSSVSAAEERTEESANRCHRQSEIEMEMKIHLGSGPRLLLWRNRVANPQLARGHQELGSMHPMMLLVLVADS